MQIKYAALKEGWGEKQTTKPSTDIESRGNTDLHAFVVLILVYNMSE